MNEPLVSIVIIGYNIEKYIGNCLQSAIDQTYKKIEIIFVNDGSKDNTLAKAKEYESGKIITIINKENGGIVSARKAGVRAASGNYVTFVDGDDWLNTDMVQNLVTTLIEKGDMVDIISSQMNRQEQDGMFFIQKNEVCPEVCNGDEYFQLIMADQTNHHMFPKLYRKQFILDSGYLNYPNVTMAEDLMTNAFFGIHQPKVVFSKSINYFYRYNESSVIRSGNSTLLCQIKTLEYMEKYIESVSKYDTWQELMEYQWFSYVYTYMHSPLTSQIKCEIMEGCRGKLKNYKSNNYCQNLICKYPWHINILFVLYYNIPWAAGVIDLSIATLKEIKRR